MPRIFSRLANARVRRTEKRRECATKRIRPMNLWATKRNPGAFRFVKSGVED